MTLQWEQFDPESFRRHLLNLQADTGIELGNPHSMVGRNPVIGRSRYERWPNGAVDYTPSGAESLNLYIPHESGALTVGQVHRTLENPNDVSAGLFTQLYPYGKGLSHIQHNVRYEGPDKFNSLIREHINEVESNLRKRPIDPGVKDFMVGDIQSMSSRTPSPLVEGAWNSMEQEDLINDAKDIEAFGHFDPSRNYHFRKGYFR